MQQDVADACGLSTAQANRTIPELRRRELIEWNGHAVDFLRDQFELLGEFRAHASCAEFLWPPLRILRTSKSTSARQFRSVPTLFDLQPRSLGCAFWNYLSVITACAT
jgi:hypothetical protein